MPGVRHGECERRVIENRRSRDQAARGRAVAAAKRAQDKPVWDKADSIRRFKALLAEVYGTGEEVEENVG